MRTPVCTNACQWCISQLLIFSNLLSEKWHLRKVLICIALKSVKMNIYSYLRATCTSFSMNCLFITLAHFFLLSFWFYFVGALYILEKLSLVWDQTFSLQTFCSLYCLLFGFAYDGFCHVEFFNFLCSQITKILFHDFSMYVCVFPYHS